MKAFAANGMDSEMPQMDEQMKQALEQIESSDMTEKQKENMRQMMQSSMQLMNSYVNAPETDKAAVLPCGGDSHMGPCPIQATDSGARVVERRGGDRLGWI